MKTIPLTQGYLALVDDSDYNRVSEFKWFVSRAGRCLYAATSGRTPNGKPLRIYLHRFLVPGAVSVDHWDGDGLNCQRYNLRPATKRQNGQAKIKKPAGVASRFRGVSRRASGGKWQAQIKNKGRSFYLGTFHREEDAALAYDAAARKYFGNFAAPNFP